MLKSARKGRQRDREKGGNGGLNLPVIPPFKKYYQAANLVPATLNRADQVLAFMELPF